MMGLKTVNFVFCIIFLIGYISAERILLCVHLIYSHVLEFSAFGEELVSRGHEVYIVIPETSPYVLPVSEKGFNVITFYAEPSTLFFGTEEWHNTLSELTFENVPEAWRLASEVANRHCEMILSNATMMTMLRSLQFKISVVEPALNYCPLLIPYVLSIPFINSGALISYWSMGIPALPSFVATQNQMAGDKLSLFEKNRINISPIYR